MLEEKLILIVNEKLLCDKGLEWKASLSWKEFTFFLKWMIFLYCRKVLHFDALLCHHLLNLTLSKVGNF